MRKMVNRPDTGVEIREYSVDNGLVIKIDVGDVSGSELINKLPVMDIDADGNEKESVGLVFKFGEAEAERVEAASNKEEECLDIISEKLFPLEAL